MAVITATEHEFENIKIAKWLTLATTDTGSPVDVSRYSRIFLVGTGTFDGESFTAQGADTTLAGAVGSYGAWPTRDGYLTPTFGTMAVDGAVVELNPSNTKWIRVTGNGAGTTVDVDVVLIATR